jgi:hypothetical protein
MKKDGKISVRKIQIGILFCIAFIAVFVWAITVSSNRGHNLRVALLDVGQGPALRSFSEAGDSILIHVL